MLLDIDECLIKIHKCPQNQSCVNRPGDYVCKCESGYKLSNDFCIGNHYLNTKTPSVLKTQPSSYSTVKSE